MGVLEPILTYDRLVENLGLTVIQEGGDLAIENGDIKLTRDNDFFMGPDAAFNAMMRLTSAWSYGSSTMRLFHRSIADLRREQAGLWQAIENAHAGGLVFRTAAAPDALDAYHAANQAQTAGAIGAAAIAGSLMILAASYLGRFKGDLKPPAQFWDSCEPRINGVSVGPLVLAAANAFRHADEWAEARAKNKFTDQQRKLMDLLALALRERDDDIPPWEQVLNVLCGGNGLEGLSASVLTYANNVASEVRRRSNP